MAYLRRTQEADGSWFGRWGVNYIYGTWQGSPAWRPWACGRGPGDGRRCDWLLVPAGRAAAGANRPTATPIRTSAAKDRHRLANGLGRDGAGRGRAGDHPAIARGIRYLIDTQQDDGTWDEPEFTGTGFPQVFYLRYHWYPMYFPLMALAQWAAAVGRPRAMRARHYA